MNLADKRNLLRESKGTYNLCKCVFSYTPNSAWYFYIVDCTDKLFYGAAEQDFILNGFEIRRISDLKKIEIMDIGYAKINEENKLLADLKKPQLDLSSWQTVFESLKALNVYVIIENENTKEDLDFFHIGYIKDVKESCVIFSSFDADGEWTENIIIPYSKITTVTFNDRYSTTWRKYLERHNQLPSNQE